MTTPLFATNIRVSVDPNPANLQASFQLSFTANAQPDGEPDFSPLDKDFKILSQSQQQSVQIINWKKTRSTQWILTVKAKRAGSLVIPVINFGKDSSPYTSIVINQAGEADTANQHLFLQVEVDTPKPYIQQQVIYTLKLLRKMPNNIASANLTAPVLPDAVIKKLGEDKSYNAQYQGDDYAVTERQYAIFPQKSGQLTIAPLELTATIIMPDQRWTNRFFKRQRTQTKHITSAAITVNVQPKPANAKADWLPAKQVSLQEKWLDRPEKIIVGQPFTRTITLRAEGTTVGVLPKLYQDNMPQHLKAYPDQPILKEGVTDAGVLAVREENIALICGQAGRYTLPAIEVAWWNTQTQTMEMARIAEQTIIATMATASEPASTQAPAGNTGQMAMVAIQQKSTLWFWVAVFFISIWLMTLAYCLFTKPPNNTKKHRVIVEKKPTTKKMLQKACINHNPIMAKDALLQLGVPNLTKIAAQYKRPLMDEILALNAVLYGDKPEAWQGDSLWTAFQNNQAEDVAKKELADPLQTLFKI